MINNLKLRPLMFFSILFIFTVYFSTKDNSKAINIAVIIAIIYILSAIVLYITGKKKKVKNAFIWLLFLPFCFGIISGSLFGYNYKRTNIDIAKALNRKTGTSIGVVSDVVYESDYFSTYIVEISSFDNRKIRIKTAVSFNYDTGISENDIISFISTYSLPDNDDNGFNEYKYYLSEGIFIITEGADNSKILGADESLPSKMRTLSKKISTMFNTALGSEAGGFASGLLIGRRDEVPDRLSGSFEYLGITHILSVSGLHLTIILGAVSWLLLKLFMPHSVRFVACTAVTLFFVLLTGAQPAIMRAGIMVFLYYFAFMIGRFDDKPTSLFIAALCIVLFEPSSVYSLSFILSVLSTLGIIALGVPACSFISKKIKKRNQFFKLIIAFLMSVSISLSATLFTLPVVWYYFGQVSPNAVFANLIFIPLCTLMMFMSILVLIFYHTPILNIFSVPTNALYKLIDRLSYALTSDLPAPISLRFHFTFIAVLITAIIVVFLIIKKKHRCRILIAATLSFATVFSSGYIIYKAQNADKTAVLCVNNNKNDYVLINTDFKTLVCDFSDGSYNSLYNAALKAEEMYDTSVDVLLLTHLHRKHISTFARFADNVGIKKVILPTSDDGDIKIFSSAIIKAANERNIEVITFDSEKDFSFDFEGTDITVYKNEYIKRSVQPIHLVLFANQRMFIYAGASINESQNKETFDKLCIDADYLWLGTHGPNIKKDLILKYNVKNTFSLTNINELYNTQFSIFEMKYKFFLTYRSKQ